MASWVSPIAGIVASWLGTRVFWVLALLPGATALFMYFSRVRPLYLKIRGTVIPPPGQKAAPPQDINEYLDMAMVSRQTLEDNRPRLIRVLIGSLLVTAVLGIAAALSNAPTGIGLDGQASDGVKGLVYSAYGAYVALIVAMIGRVNGSAVSAKFLVNSAIRVAMAMVLGFLAGEIQLFAFVEDKVQAAVFFLIGLFPLWALEALQRRAREVFRPADPGCEVLPLCLVEGLDGTVVDRLEEIGISDIEHLSTADPAELRLATLYSGKSILDWLDQAILISYVKRNIVAFRRLGIRGAIDLASLYADAHPEMGFESDESAETRKVRAEAVFVALASEAKLPLEVIHSTGRLLYDDSSVNRIWELWTEAGEEAEGSDQGGAKRDRTEGDAEAP